METRELQVKVVGPDGLPVAGATVTPCGMRSKEARGSCYGWGPRKIPGVDGGTSDATGAATITFPAHCPDELTTGTIIVRVEHVGSCAAQVEVDVDAPRPIVLERGTRVRFTAQPGGVVYSELYADIEHDERQSGRLKWEREPDGLSLSSYLSKGKYIARVVGFTEAGEVYFGEPKLFSVPALDGADIHLAWAKKKGTSIKGMFGPEAPRPIRNGWAVAVVTSPKRVENACGVLATRWEVSVDVARDGSFILANLPEGTLEIVAGCEGYVSRHPGERSNYGIHEAQIMPDDRSLPLELPMEATGTARLVVRAPNGQPLANADVFFSPNQSLGRHTSIIGTRFNSVDVLRAREQGTLGRKWEVPRFGGKTDEEGVIVVPGLPPGQQGFQVMSEKYDMPIEDEQRALLPGEIRVPRRMGRIAIRPGEESSAELRMEPKGSTSLSAAIQAAERNSRRCR